MLFLFLYIQTDSIVPLDLIFIPWLGWIGKKIFELVRTFKLNMAFLNQELEFKLDLFEKEA